MKQIQARMSCAPSDEVTVSQLVFRLERTLGNRKVKREFWNRIKLLRAEEFGR